jgi:hypothetical protein
MVLDKWLVIAHFCPRLSLLESNTTGHERIGRRFSITQLPHYPLTKYSQIHLPNILERIGIPR